MSLGDAGEDIGLALKLGNLLIKLFLILLGRESIGNLNIS